MKLVNFKTTLMLVALVWLALVGCSDSRISSDADIANREVLLEDGIYPVIETPTGEAGIVELAKVPVASDTTPENVHVIGRPLLRFRQVSNPDFKFDAGQCTQITLENSDELEAHTRTHVGSLVAVVIDGRVITSHRIREAIETDEFQITFCIEGAGDHLHEHLEELRFAAGT